MFVFQKILLTARNKSPIHTNKQKAKGNLSTHERVTWTCGKLCMKKNYMIVVLSHWEFHSTCYWMRTSPVLTDKLTSFQDWKHILPCLPTTVKCENCFSRLFSCQAWGRALMSLTMVESQTSMSGYNHVPDPHHVSSKAARDLRLCPEGAGKVEWSVNKQ